MRKPLALSGVASLLTLGVSVAAVEFLRVPISTNAAGDGHAKSPTIPPEAVEGLAGEHGVNWIVYDGDTAAYETGCQNVILD